MSLTAVVPVQNLETAKSRLASILSPQERSDLVLTLFDNVMTALTGSLSVVRMVVVSPDPNVLAIARRWNADPVEQPGRGLNAAIRLGRDRAVGLGADSILIVLADLPRITPADVDRLAERSHGMSVTMAPDRHGRGTNAMILRPPTAIEPAFGVDSLLKHRREVAIQGLASSTFESAGTGFDVDVIDDLIDLGWLDPVTHARHMPLANTPIVTLSGEASGWNDPR